MLALYLKAVSVGVGSAPWSSQCWCWLCTLKQSMLVLVLHLKAVWVLALYLKAVNVGVGSAPLSSVGVGSAP